MTRLALSLVIMGGSVSFFAGLGSVFSLTPDVTWLILIMATLGAVLCWLVWKIRRLMGIAVALTLFYGCASQPTITRIEFSCVSYVKGEYIISDCADAQSWKAWMEKQYH